MHPTPKTTRGARTCRMGLLALAGAFGLGLAAAPAPAQAQLGVCGVPPLPPCVGQVPPRPDYDRPRYRDDIPRGRAERISDFCRTPDTRCRVDSPRPVGARCTCVDEDGDESFGRIR